METFDSIGEMVRYIFSSEDIFMRLARGIVLVALFNHVLFLGLSLHLNNMETVTNNTQWWSGTFQNWSSELLGIALSALVFSLFWRVLELRKGKELAHDKNTEREKKKKTT